VHRDVRLTGRTELERDSKRWRPVLEELLLPAVEDRELGSYPRSARLQQMPLVSNFLFRPVVQPEQGEDGRDREGLLHNYVVQRETEGK
jgi:hypothetical protein